MRQSDAQKNPRAHKNKIGTSPPQEKKPNTPQSVEFMGMEVFWGLSSRKNQKMPGAHKIGAAISGPELWAGILWTSRFP